MSLVIVGSIALDTVETPAGKVSDILGGSASYGSIAASGFTNVHLVGVVGDDFPREAVELFRARGINLDGLEVQAGKTFRWSGKYNNFNQAETLSTDLNVFADFEPKLPENCRSCHSLFLGNIHPALQLAVLAGVEHYSLVACDTMNYWINLCPEILTEVIQKVDIVFINEDEIRLYTGISNIFEAARKILDLGPQVVVIKRGEYGSITINNDSYYFAPAYPIYPIKDTTGAGDSFAGGFLGYLAECGELNENNLRAAVRYGTVMAALDVSEFSILGLVNASREQVDTMESNLQRWT